MEHKASFYHYFEPVAVEVDNIAVELEEQGFDIAMEELVG
jgi:hypothetical protein